MPKGLFVGLTTLDWIYHADHPPTANEKVVATQAMMAAGGPATNAAVTFSQLADSADKNHATILAALGQHPLATLIQNDLAQWQITLIDLQPDQIAPPPVSSIVVTQATGERAVVSRNAVNRQVLSVLEPLPELKEKDILLIDGHQMALGATLAKGAKQQQIPVVVDAGSWKPKFETVLSQADVVIASANFRPPTQQAPMDYLEGLEIANIAITQGGDPIQVSQDGDRCTLSVPTVKVIDTLGAGDIFHGAFCHYYLTVPPDQKRFLNSLQLASQVAAFACQFFGTRRWLAQAPEFLNNPLVSIFTET